jgi:hypothetical protein
LPKCWQSCFASADDGCGSSACESQYRRLFCLPLTGAGICETSQDSAAYLPSAVSCAVSKCDADGALPLILGQLQLLCIGLNCAIPDDVMDEAYAIASGSNSDDESPQSTRTPVAVTSTRKSARKTSTPSGDAQELTSTIRSTFTRTTTDSSGRTVQVVVPIAVGPSGIVTGSIATSTLSGQAASTRPLSATSPSPSAAASSPASTRPPTSTSPAAAERTESPARGNGSPFENMQATGSIWTLSKPLLGLGALILFYMRL